mmetsp:Transcript_117792/g.293744  ORF Transcript_117792/g.293744 Transcript_117792/m.293744 type:complete len:245 (+) Transcript_117792:935-1669(+)
MLPLHGFSSFCCTAMRLQRLDLRSCPDNCKFGSILNCCKYGGLRFLFRFRCNQFLLLLFPDDPTPALVLMVFRGCLAALELQQGVGFPDDLQTLASCTTILGLQNLDNTSDPTLLTDRRDRLIEEERWWRCKFGLLAQHHLWRRIQIRGSCSFTKVGLRWGRRVCLLLALAGCHILELELHLAGLLCPRLDNSDRIAAPRQCSSRDDALLVDRVHPPEDIRCLPLQPTLIAFDEGLQFLLGGGL